MSDLFVLKVLIQKNDAGNFVEFLKNGIAENALIKSSIKLKGQAEVIWVLSEGNEVIIQ